MEDGERYKKIIRELEKELVNLAFTSELVVRYTDELQKMEMGNDVHRDNLSTIIMLKVAVRDIYYKTKKIREREMKRVDIVEMAKRLNKKG